MHFLNKLCTKFLTILLLFLANSLLETLQKLPVLNKKASTSENCTQDLKPESVRGGNETEHICRKEESLIDCDGDIEPPVEGMTVILIAPLLKANYI